MIVKKQGEIDVSIIGDYYVGKTTIFKSIFGENLEEDQGTIGIENRQKVIEINKMQYKLNIYDTPGYNIKTYEKLLAMEYSDIIIFVYNTEQFSTFEAIKDLFDDTLKEKYDYQIWLKGYKKVNGCPKNNNKVFGLLGNIYNNKDSFNDIQEDEIQKFSMSIDAKRIKMYKGEFINEFLEEILKLYLNKNDLYNSIK